MDDSNDLYDADVNNSVRVSVTLKLLLFLRDE